MPLTPMQQEIIKHIFQENKRFGVVFLMDRIIMLSVGAEARLISASRAAEYYLDDVCLMVRVMKQLFPIMQKKKRLGRRMLREEEISNLFDEICREGSRNPLLLQRLAKKNIPNLSDIAKMPEESQISLLSLEIAALHKLTGIAANKFFLEFSEKEDNFYFWSQVKKMYASSLLVRYEESSIIKSLSLMYKLKTIFELKKSKNATYYETVAFIVENQVRFNKDVTSHQLWIKIQKLIKDQNKYAASFTRYQPLSQEIRSNKLQNALVLIAVILIISMSLAFLFNLDIHLAPLSHMLFAQLAIYLLLHPHHVMISKDYPELQKCYEALLNQEENTLLTQSAKHCRFHVIDIEMPKEFPNELSQSPTLQEEKEGRMQIFMMDHELPESDEPESPTEPHELKTSSEQEENSKNSAPIEKEPEKVVLLPKPVKRWQQPSELKPVMPAVTLLRDNKKNKFINVDVVHFEDEVTGNTFTFSENQENSPIKRIHDGTGTLFGIIDPSILSNDKIPEMERKDFVAKLAKGTYIAASSNTHDKSASRTGVKRANKTNLIYIPENRTLVPSPLKLKISNGSRLFARYVKATDASYNGVAYKGPKKRIRLAIFVEHKYGKAAHRRP